MFGRDFCPHCQTFHPENWEVGEPDTTQDGDWIIVGNTYRCKHCKGLYRHVEVFELKDTDSIPIHEKN